MRKPPFWATFCTLLSILILCALGTWQIKRLHWKEGLLAKLDQAYSDPHPPVISPAALQALGAGADFKAVSLHGHFVPGLFLHMDPRTWQGRYGYHMIAPFVLDDDSIVLVNRGWLPHKTEIEEEAQDDAALPSSDLQTIAGILHSPGRENPFVPQNKDGHWYRWDLHEMALTFDVTKVAPVVLYETAEPKGHADAPVRAALHWELPNNHLYYACFWFTMALVLAGMYGLRFLVKQKA